MNVSHNIRLCLLIAVVILFPASSICDELENPLLGRWALQRVHHHDAKSLHIEWEFTKDLVIVRDKTNKQEISRNKYIIDLTKDPKWITVTVGAIAKEIRPGIFRIMGDKLHIKQEVEGGERPKILSENGYSIMERVKEPKGQTGEPSDD